MKKLISSIILLLAIFFINLEETPAAQNGDSQMKIKITSHEHTIYAELNNTPTAQDLFNKLPITLKMTSHQNREYYTDISLSKKTSTQNDYKIGDIAYWTPGNSMVMFYDKGYSSNLIIMGHIISGLDVLPKMGMNFMAKIEKIKD